MSAHKWTIFERAELPPVPFLKTVPKCSCALCAIRHWDFVIDSSFWFLHSSFPSTPREGLLSEPDQIADPLRVVYLGSGEFGLPTLKHLWQQHDVVAVITQPDRPAGRKRRMTPTRIAAWAQDAGLNVIKSGNVNDQASVDVIRQIDADVAMVMAFGQKLAPPVIAALGRLVVNLHGSLLPRYRGAAPVNWAVINGETETGVSVISLSQRMDAGVIYAQATTPISPLSTAGELHECLASLGPQVIEQVLDQFKAGALAGVPQDDALASRAPKLSRSDGWVDFHADALTIQRRIHGLTPWPGVKVTWRQTSGEEHELALLRVDAEPGYSHGAEPGTILPGNLVAVGALGHRGAVRLLEIQPPGRRAMTIQQFAAGHSFKPGDRLTSLIAPP